MASDVAVGIDLGTTNSAVAWIDEKGHSVMIRNTEGELLTPSVVLFSDSETVVGKSARSASTVHPDQVAQWVKRDMGLASYHHPIRGQLFPPEVIQACILRKLKEDIVAELGTPGRSVITVPAYFDEPRRKATADTGQMAGLDVLDIVNEPTAAALAFGERLGYLSPSGTATGEMTVLVYDLGGGTFDVTVLHLAPGNIQTLATDGDVQLGGHDWDLRLVDHVAEKFIESGGPDPRQDPYGLGRLYLAVEEAKHTLSARNRTAVRLDHAGRFFSLEVNREQFADMTADLLERTICTTHQVLTDARLSWNQISRILLVGGATRMPIVAERLERMSRIRPDRTVHPEEAVARGAAIYAGFLLNQQAGRDTGFDVSNVNSHSLGVEGIDPETMRKTSVTLIPRNTPLPATLTDRFTTKRDGQQSIVIQVLEGESSNPEECTHIGRTVVRGLPPDLPQGTPIDVTFSYQANGRLQVFTRIPGVEQENRLTIERNSGLSDAKIDHWGKSISSAASFDEMAAMLVSMDDDEEETSPPEPASPVSRVPASAEPPAPAAERPQPRPVPAQPKPPAPPRQSASPTPRSAAARSTPDTWPQRTVAGTGTVPAQRRTVMESPDFVESEGGSFSARSSPSNLRFWVLLAGWIMSSVVGIGLGYLLVLWLFPEIDWPRPW